MVEWEYAVLTLEFPELPTLGRQGGKGAERDRDRRNEEKASERRE